MLSWRKALGVVAVTASYGYLFFTRFSGGLDSGIVLCPFKRITGLACPGCGSIRATRLFFQGRFTDSVLTNPTGIILLVFALFYLLGSLYDVVFGKNIVYRCTHGKMPVWCLVLLLALVAANEVWNIRKGL